MIYKCPNCNGALEYNPITDEMECAHCGDGFTIQEMENKTRKPYDYVTENNIISTMTEDNTTSVVRDENVAENEAVADQDIENLEDEHNFYVNKERMECKIYTCTSCGAELAVSDTEVSTWCAYCGQPTIVYSRVSNELKPDYVIPFKLDKKAAKEGMMNHLKGKRLLPKAFKDENHIDEIKGIYVPFWLFDTDSDAKIHYLATKVRRWSDSRYTYKETSFFSLLRAGSVSFQRVPVDGSTQMPDDLMESIEPYNFKDAVDFQTAYLAGYLADKYDVTAEESIDRANQRIKRSTEEVFRSTIQGYSTVTPDGSSVKFKNGSAKYALYPVWILNTSWEGKNYTFAMNGQTGKFVGDLPLDKGAYWRWWGGLTAAFSAAIFVGALLLHFLV